MNKRGHWILGAVFVFIFVLITGYFNLNLFYFTSSSVLFIIGIVAFYSILPDIDHKSGTMTWTFLGIATFGIVLGIVELVFKFGNPLNLLITSATLLVFTFISAKFFPHRGIVHSVPVGLLSVVPLWFLFHNLSFCILGYISWHSHLIGDGYLFKVR